MDSLGTIYSTLYKAKDSFMWGIHWYPIHELITLDFTIIALESPLGESILPWLSGFFQIIGKTSKFIQAIP